MAVVAVVGVAAVLVVWRAWTWASPHRVSAWAARRDLELNEEGMAHLIHYLRTVRRCRTTGWVALLVVMSTGPTLGLEGIGSGVFLGIVPMPHVIIAIMGAAVGTAVAEILLTRSTEDRVAAARLRRRTITDYTARDAGWLAVSSAIVFFIAVVGHRIAQTTSTVPQFVGGPSREFAQWIGLPALAVAVVVSLELLRRWIVARAQIAKVPDVVKADDAGRVAQVQMVVGLQIATGFFAAGQAFASTAWLLSGAVGPPLAGQVLCGIAGLAVLIRYGPGTVHVGGPGHEVVRT